MGKDENLITAEILAYMRSAGGDVTEWYVAPTISAGNSLFDHHRVVKQEDLWIYRKALSPDAASRVANYFQREMGTDGCPGEGEGARLFVYAYRKRPHTEP